MTMANLIVQRDRAFLMTDSGYFTRDGTILALHPKSMILEHLSLAIAMSGSVGCGHLAEQIKKTTFPDVQSFLRQLGPMLRAAYSSAGLDPTKDFSRAFVAFYSHEHRRPYGCTLFTSDADGPAHLSPWQAHPAAVALTPEVDQAAVFGGLIDLTDQALFDPALSSLPLIEAQRAVGGSWGEGGSGCRVAGDIDLTVISAAGIEVQTLHSFPDLVGSLAGAQVEGR